jgi:hypothetical protein
VLCDAAEYSTLAQVYSVTSRHKLHHRIGNVLIILYHNNIILVEKLTASLQLRMEQTKTMQSNDLGSLANGSPLCILWCCRELYSSSM